MPKGTPLRGRKLIERKEEEDWLRRCLPVIVQPEIDVKAGHPLLTVFFKFRREGGDVSCEVSLIFKGEATYAPPCCNRVDAVPQVSHSMTYVYRTWNRFAYERTADINSFIYLGVDFKNKAEPFSSIWMCDASGQQSWAAGDKLQWPGCVTIHNHFIAETPLEEWAAWEGGAGNEQGGSTASSTTRPLVFLNTCNHMMSTWDANPSLPKRFWVRYCVCRGGRGLAETYARRCIRQKPNLTSLIVCDPIVALCDRNRCSLTGSASASCIAIRAGLA